MPFAAPSRIAANPGVSSVILTSTDHFGLSSHKLDFSFSGRNPGLVTVAESLNAVGFNRISLTKPHDEYSLDLEKNEAAIVDNLRSIGAAEKGAVIGISVLSDQYHRFPYLSRLVRGVFPDARIIAGGPHFIREEIDGHVDPVESALKMNLADGIQVGDDASFVEWVVTHGGRMGEVEGSGFYQLDSRTGDVLGHGVGEYPFLKSVPFETEQDGKFLSVQLSTACRNGCDFCAISKRLKPKFPTEMVVENLGRQMAKDNTIRLSLSDPNPFAAANIAYYEQTFDALDLRHLATKDAYLDPAALVPHDHFERVIQLIGRSMFMSFFAGRDAVTERDSAAIGTRYLGGLKDQQMLDAEVNALKAFVGALKVFHKQIGIIRRPIGLIVSYIMGPLDRSGLNVGDVRRYGVTSFSR